MGRALVLGFLTWCVQALLLVVLVAAGFAVVGPPAVISGPPCPCEADWRQLGGDGTLLPKFFSRQPLDVEGRVSACIAKADTDLPAAILGISRLGSAAAPTLFHRLRSVTPEARPTLNALLRAALPKALPAPDDDSTGDDPSLEKWLQIASIDGPDLTAHEAELAVDRLLIHPSSGREEAVRQLGTVAIPALIQAMPRTRSRRQLALLSSLAHEATERGPTLRLTATAAEVDATVGDWTQWLDDHRWDYEPHPVDRRIPWGLRETRLARVLERAWASWTSDSISQESTASLALATAVTLERCLVALVLGRALLGIGEHFSVLFRLRYGLTVLLGALPGAALALLARPVMGTMSAPVREVLLLLMGGTLAAVMLAPGLAHELRLRNDPIARLVERKTPCIVQVSLAAVAPVTLGIVLFLEDSLQLGGLGAAFAHGHRHGLGTVGLPALTRMAIVLPALPLALRLLRHLVGDERMTAHPTGHPKGD